MKKKIVFFPFFTQGHVNVCAALANRILERHGQKVTIYFLQNESYSYKIRELCPQAEIITYLHPTDEIAAEKKLSGALNVLLDEFEEFGKLWDIDNILQRLNSMHEMYDEILESLKVVYDRVTPLLLELQPDLFIYDQLMTSPIGQDLGIPWALLLSSAPTLFGHWQLPPPISDLPGEFTRENVKLWKDYNEKSHRTGNLLAIHDKLNEWLKAHNCVNLDSYDSFYTASPYFNIYNYPAEIDYCNDIVRMPGTWHRIDSAVQVTETEKYPLPESFLSLPGYLVYLSLGSLATAYEPLMERLLNLLRKLPHKFIVSIGPKISSDMLGHNLIGEVYLPQEKVLNTVDVMISHGGNNTLTECFHYGVPAIIMPLYSDQMANAQRIVETGYGIKANACTVTENELSEMIEKLATDKIIRNRFAQASKRMKENNNLSEVADKVANFVMASGKMRLGKP